MNIILTVLTILVILAIVYLLFYLFSKYVFAIDNKIVGICLFILAAILAITALTGSNIVFWR